MSRYTDAQREIRDLVIEVAAGAGERVSLEVEEMVQDALTTASSYEGKAQLTRTESEKHERVRTRLSAELTSRWERA